MAAEEAAAVVVAEEGALPAAEVFLVHRRVVGDHDPAAILALRLGAVLFPVHHRDAPPGRRLAVLLVLPREAFPAHRREAPPGLRLAVLHDLPGEVPPVRQVVQVEPAVQVLVECQVLHPLALPELTVRRQEAAHHNSPPA